jgi:hypothetical protein
VPDHLSTVTTTAARRHDHAGGSKYDAAELYGIVNADIRKP